MPKKCQITQKRGRSANKVSHSNVKTKTRQEANLQWSRFMDPETGKWVRIRVSASTLKTITRKGLRSVLKKNKVTL